MGPSCFKHDTVQTLLTELDFDPVRPIRYRLFFFFFFPPSKVLKKVVFNQTVAPLSPSSRGSALTSSRRFSLLHLHLILLFIY